MPDVRLAATGMDSCPASDEDTEDELESARTSNSVRSHLLPSTSRQLVRNENAHPPDPQLITTLSAVFKSSLSGVVLQVGESNRPSFRPGLEGGSSDDEDSTGRGGHFLSGIEHRRSAEGQVISSPLTGRIKNLHCPIQCTFIFILASCFFFLFSLQFVHYIHILYFSGLCLTTGDGGGGDGSSGSEDSGNDGGVSTIPLPSANVQTTYDVLRGLGIVGSSAAADNSNASHLPGRGRNTFPLLTEVGFKQKVHQ